MVSFLLDNRANVRWKDVCGGTYLHMAARSGHDDIARLLLDRGVDRSARETGGKTAADLARRWEEDYGKGKRLVNI
jgi:ankyrin repeat protein